MSLDDCLSKNPLLTAACGTRWISMEAAVERVKGIEPSSVAWEATALPLSYTRGQECAGKRWPGAKSSRACAPPASHL